MFHLWVLLSEWSGAAWREVGFVWGFLESVCVPFLSERARVLVKFTVD